MSVDIREDILARLLAVVAGIPNIRSAQRNNVDVTDEMLPAVTVFDGDEETNAASFGSKPSTAPMLATMTPEIIVQEMREVTGSELGAMRRELVRRVLTDTALIALAGSNGAIRYMGCQTDFGWLRAQYNAMNVQFTIKYPLKPEEL